MLYVLIVASDLKFACAAEHGLVFDSNVNGSSRRDGVDSREIHRILLSAEVGELQGFREAEEAIAGFLREKDVVHDRFVGILQVGASCAGNIPSLSSRQGCLVLSFPEIQWIPVYGSWRDDFGESTGGMTWKRAVRLCRSGYSPLFDGDGLRSCLMQRIHGCYSRGDVAIAVDEETNFAQMNAYTAYRFGYRAYPVPSRDAANELLRGQASDLPVALTLKENELGDLKEFRTHILSPVVVVFEDVQLQFSDDETPKVPSFGVARDGTYGLLTKADLRVVATATLAEEPIADGGKSTIEDFFRKRENGLGGRYLSLNGQNRRERFAKRRRRERERLSRWWFNASGAWAGHWIVNVADAMLMTAVLLGMSFCNVNVSLSVLFGFFLFRVVLLNGLRIANVHGEFLPECLCRFFARREQWRFLPKRYLNHCPEDLLRKGKNNTYWTMANKPLAGIFGLRNACCLPNGRGFQGLYDSRQVRERYQRAQDGNFGELGAWGRSREDISHAAPGMALEIAVRLLRRAEQLEVENRIIDAEGAIHGAVLATAAGELLDSKTPAMSIEALFWKQYFELRAECEFVGVQAHPDMVDRYVDIHNAMGRICRSSDGKVRADIFNSGMAELMDKLSDLLSGKGKREEAQFFSKKARMFHRRLMNPIARTVLAYPEWLLRSAWHVVFGLAVLAVVFCTYWVVREQNAPSVLSALSKTYEVLVCDEPELKGKYTVVIRTVRLIAMLHLAFLGLCFWDSMQRK